MLIARMFCRISAPRIRTFMHVVLLRGILGDIVEKLIMAGVCICYTFIGPNGIFTLPFRVNVRELGEYVANEIIAKHLTLESYGDLDTSPYGVLDPCVPDIVKFPKFRSPRILDYHFPGGLHYFSSILPDAAPATTSSYMTTGPTDDLSRRVCGLKVLFPVLVVSDVLIVSCRLLRWDISLN